MKKQNAIYSSILLIFVTSTILLAACGTSGTVSTATQNNSTISDSQSLLEERCTVCHSTRRITSSHFDTAQWTTVVDTMINKGAQLNTQERQTLIDYLAQTYP